MSLEKMTCGVNYTTELIKNNINALIDNSAAFQPKFTSEYGLVDGDDTFDNSQPFIDMCAALSDGDTVVFGKNKTYYFLTSTIINLSQKSLNVDLNGSTLIIQNPNTVGIEFNGGWSSIQSFTDLGGTGNMVVSGIPDTSLIRPKDIVRLTSDDLAVDTRGSGAFQAEDIFVEKILDANSVQLGNLSSSIYGFNVAYTTNPRISQRNPHTVNIFNGTMKHPEGVTGLTQLNAAILRLVALNKPKVSDVNTTRNYRWGLELVGCLHAEVDDCDYSVGDDSSKTGDQNVYGSGLIDCSFGTKVRGVTGKRVRHLVDTHCQNYGASPQNPELYGSSIGMVASDCFAMNTTGDSFAGHHQSRGLVYRNCTSAYSEAFGFQCRGDVTLDGCKSMYCDNDINIFDEDDLSPSRTLAKIYNHTNYRSGHLVNNNKLVPVNIYNYTGEDIISRSSTAWYASGTDESIVNFNGLTNLSFNEPLFIYDAYMGNNIKGVINFDEMHWKFNNYTIKNYRAIDIRGSGTTSNYVLQGRKLKVIGTGVDFLFRSNNAPVRDGQVMFDLVMDEGVGLWGDQAQANDNNIAILGGGDLSFVRNVNFVTERQHQAQGRVESVVANFGTSIALDEVVTTSVAIDGIMAASSYDIRVIKGLGDIVITSCEVLTDSTVTITAINKGAAARDMSSVNLDILINWV